MIPHRSRPIWQSLLAVMLVALAIVAFWPSPIDRPVQGQLADVLNLLHRRGIPHWFNYRFVEASANVALFMPLGIISALAFEEKRSWRVGAFGLLISGCMELGQILFLHSRVSSLLDLMTNTAGAVIGALLATWAVKKLEARHLSAADL